MPIAVLAFLIVCLFAWMFIVIAVLLKRGDGTTRLRPNFTIRDLLWLTLVVALVLGWSIDHRRFRRFLEKSDVVVDTRDSDKPYSLRILETKNAAEWFDKGK